MAVIYSEGGQESSFIFIADLCAEFGRTHKFLSDRFNEIIIELKTEDSLSQACSLEDAVEVVLAKIRSHFANFLSGFHELLSMSDDQVARAMAMNLLSCMDTKRKNGDPYCTHPFMVAWLAAKLIPFHPELKKIIIMALTHDVIEEGIVIPHYESKEAAQAAFLIHLFGGSGGVADVANIEEMIATCQQEMDRFVPGSGHAAYHLMEPHYHHSGNRGNKIKDFHEFFERIQEAAAEGNLDIWIVKLLDKMANLMDLDYLDNGNYSHDKKLKSLSIKIAKCWYFIKRIEELVSSDDIDGGVLEAVRWFLGEKIKVILNTYSKFKLRERAMMELSLIENGLLDERVRVAVSVAVLGLS